MKREKLEKLFELCTELYAEEQKKTGMISPQPYCYARNEETGQLLVYCHYPMHSDLVMEKIKTVGI